MGLLFYFLIYFFAFGALWQRYFLSRKDFWKTSVFTALLLAYFLQNLTVFDTPTSLLYFFLTLGFIASSLQEGNSREEMPKTNKWKIGMAFLSIIGIFGYTFFEFVIEPAQSAFLIIKAKNENEPSLRVFYARKAISLTPLGRNQVRIYFAKNYFDLVSQNQASFKEGEFLAEELQKNQKELLIDLKTSLTLSRLYLIFAQKFQQDTLKKAQIEAERAIQISPKNPQGYWLLSEIYYLQNDCTKAIYFAKYAYDLEPRIEGSLNLFAKILNLCQGQLFSK